MQTIEEFTEDINLELLSQMLTHQISREDFLAKSHKELMREEILINARYDVKLRWLEEKGVRCTGRSKTLQIQQEILVKENGASFPVKKWVDIPIVQGNMNSREYWERKESERKENNEKELQQKISMTLVEDEDGHGQD